MSALDDLLPSGLSSATLRIDTKPCALDSEVDRIASEMTAICASSRSRRIAILHRRGHAVDGITAYLAALHADLVPGLIRPSWTPDDAHLASLGFGARTRLESDGVDSVVGRLDDDGERSEDLIMFTSGSTSRPKGVRFSLRGVVDNIDAAQSFLKISSADHVALPLPVYYSYGLSTLSLGLRHGAAVTLLDYSQPPVSWLADLLRADATVLALLPHQVRLLLRVREFASDRLSSLRMITVAGGALTPEASRDLTERFPSARIMLMYGQTEAGPRASYLPPAELQRRATSIGRGIPGHTTLRLASSCRDDVAELQISSSSLMLGYLDDEACSPIENGWLNTGDLARVDEDGFFTIVGRVAPFFKPLDERVSFAEILDVAADVIPGATFRLQPMPDAVRGETIELTATVDAVASIRTEDEYVRDFRRRLGSAHAPAAVHLVVRDDKAKLA